MRDFDVGASFHLTTSPQPGWKPPQNQPLPPPFSKEREVELDPTGFTAGHMYKFLISAVVPRPIALISTVSKEAGGPTNIAPFSYFTIACHDPPTIMVSINYSRGQPKDTLKNIEETGEFVVNSFNEHLVESANHCSVPVPYNVEENILSGLTLVPSKHVKAPRCLESLVSLECKLTHCHYIKNDDEEIATGVVFGRIVGIVAKKEVIDNETKVVNMEVFKPVSRLGGNMYGRTVSGFEIARPTA
ncbi:hypothetical protein BC830DRAFT_1067804 [Chytriomyces sp. MP71]|nr:hypothetical protein BC830DRAFT_1067804 [Chytriomyces sp. MP71]